MTERELSFATMQRLSEENGTDPAGFETSSSAPVLAHRSWHASLFQNLPLPVVCYDHTGVIMDANTAARYLLGEVKANLDSRPGILHVHPDFRRKFISHIHAVAEGESQRAEIMLDAANARSVPFVFDSRRIEFGGKTLVISVLITQAERLEAEQHLRETRDRLDFIAHHDDLTGLPNRLLLKDRIQRALQRCRRYGWIGAVIFADIDRFKAINDTYGHSAGDEVIREIGARLSGAVRDHDTVCRYSGDEFVLILENITCKKDVDQVLSKLRKSISSPVPLPGHDPLRINLSYGVTIFNKRSSDSDELLKEADLAMYESKVERQSEPTYFTTDLRVAARQQQELVVEITRALEKSEFELMYQPQYDVAGETIHSVEALVRWNHPTRGLVKPDEFMAAIDTSRQTQALNDRVLELLVEQGKRWLDLGYDFGRLAINLSPDEFYGEGLVGRVEQVLRVSGFPADRLEIEITEHSVMRDLNVASRILESLQRLGIRVAIDDFGTGYSSLNYLKRLPIQRLKLDRSFVQGLPDDNHDRSIATAVCSLAHALELEVVAEGVETPQQLEFLAQIDCDYVQGFLLGSPFLPEHFGELLSKR